MDSSSYVTSVGWVVFDTQTLAILARANRPLFVGTRAAYTTGSAPYTCNNGNDVSFGGGRALGNDTFELFVGGAGAQIANFEATVTIS